MNNTVSVQKNFHFCIKDVVVEFQDHTNFWMLDAGCSLFVHCSRNTRQLLKRTSYETACSNPWLQTWEEGMWGMLQNSYIKKRLYKIWETVDYIQPLFSQTGNIYMKVRTTVQVPMSMGPENKDMFGYIWLLDYLIPSSVIVANSKSTIWSAYFGEWQRNVGWLTWFIELVTWLRYKMGEWKVPRHQFL